MEAASGSLHDRHYLQSCCRRTVSHLFFPSPPHSFLSVVRGWDQTGSNGSNLSFPQQFGIPDSGSSAEAARNQWIVGLINSGYSTCLTPSSTILMLCI